MKLLIAFLFSISLLQCGDDSVGYVSPDCNEFATVVDYSGQDGCGLLLQLSDGKLLNPLRLTYIQAPTREQDPIYHYALQAGEKLYIGYRIDDQSASACMTGQLAFITCIRSAEEK